MKLRERALTALLGLPSLLLITETTPARAEGVQQGFDVVLPYEHLPVRVNGTERLTYELHLTNLSSLPLTLRKIEILDEQEHVLWMMSDDALRQAMGLAHDPAATGSDIVAPGTRAVVYPDPQIGSEWSPGKLRHRIFYVEPGSDPRVLSLVIAPMRIAHSALPQLGPPLRGGPWVAVYLPDMAMGHRRYLYATEGRARIPGRYAIDWMKPPGRGTGVGEEVLAVADGAVVALRDGVSQPDAAAETRSVPLSEAAGNYVVIDIGGGRFAFYEHLLPGLSVKLGDRVQRGQAVGRLGATGQVTQPQRHFSLGDAPSLLGAEGMPYRLSGARTIGRYATLDSFLAGQRWQPATWERNDDFNAPFDVVTFAYDAGVSKR